MGNTVVCPIQPKIQSLEITRLKSKIECKEYLLRSQKINFSVFLISHFCFLLSPFTFHLSVFTFQFSPLLLSYDLYLAIGAEGDNGAWFACWVALESWVDNKVDAVDDCFCHFGEIFRALFSGYIGGC